MRLVFGWICRYWRGGYPLWAQLLIFVPSCVAVFELYEFARWGCEPLALHIAFVRAIVASLCAVVVGVWVFVGMERAVRNYSKRGGRLFLAILLRLFALIPLAAFSSLGAFGAYPHLSLLGFELFESFQDPQPDIVLLNEDRAAFLSGYIAYGSDRTLQRFLDDNPSVQILGLAGPGGQNFPAVRMQRLIRERGLITAVSGECASACTTVFMGGVDRFLHLETGALGFHTVSNAVGSHEQAMQQHIKNHVAMGMSEQFAQRIHQVPADQMDYPPVLELLRHGVITGTYVDGGLRPYLKER